ANTGGYTNNTLPLCVGYDQNGGNSFSGQMDEFRLYNRGLSRAEVNSLYIDLSIFNKAAKHFVCGNALTLTANTGGGFGSTFKWYKNGIEIPGATTINLNFPTTSAADQGVYTFTYERNCVINTSKPIEVFYGPVSLSDSAMFLNLSMQAGDWTDKGENALTFTPESAATVSANAFGSTDGAIKNSNGMGLVVNSSAMNLTNQFSYSGWINSDFAYPDQRIIDKSSIGSNLNYMIDLYQQNVRVIVASSSFTSKRVIQNKQWYHLAVTYDGTTVKLYINGVLDNSAASNASFVNNSLQLIIGNTQNFGYPFSGSMSAIRLYKRALTQQEIDILRATEKPAYVVGNLPDVNFCPGGMLYQPFYADNVSTLQWFHNLDPITPLSGSPLTVAPALASDSGNYAVELTSFDNNCIKTMSQYFVASDRDTSIIGTVSLNAGVYSSNQTGSGYTYVWVDNNLAQVGVTGNAFTPPADGNYAVLITETTCGYSRYSEWITVSNTGLQKNTAYVAPSVFPVPASNFITVDVKNTVLAEIYNIEGKLLISQRLTPGNAVISVGELTNGFYILRIIDNGQQSRTKIIKN
ncbi:MAG TPA: LamG-like jellyroll fold domain-containing protein, partial [Bacteroidia bacterium]